MYINSTVSSDCHLEIGPEWSDQHHTDCFKYSQSSVPRPVCSTFPEANSQNCGSLCHGYGLVILQSTSSTLWEFQYLRQLTDMAQNIIYSP